MYSYILIYVNIKKFPRRFSDIIRFIIVTDRNVCGVCVSFKCVMGSESANSVIFSVRNDTIRKLGKES